MSRKRILIVDDALLMRELLSIFLLTECKDLDIEVVTASDGWTAFDVILKEAFDLVLTDNNMPGLKGSELVVAVHDRGCTVPFIMVTGDDEDQIPKVARELLKGVVSKPFDLARLNALIRQTL